MQALSRRKLKLAAMDTCVSVAQQKYIKNYLINRRRISLFQYAIFIFLLIVWEVKKDESLVFQYTIPHE